MKKNIVFAALILFASMVWTCKKDDSTETLPSLTGITLDSEVPKYVAEGTTVTIKCDISNLAVSSGDDFPETLGLYWMVNSKDKDTLTTNAFKYNPSFVTTLEEEGNYSITCFAYAEGFYNASASLSVTVLNPSTTMAGLSGEADTEIGGNLYRVIDAGEMTWMAGNLFGTVSGVHYQDSEVVSSSFGKYYTWEEAQSACPEGWRLPSGEEFDTCLGSASGDLMADASFVDVKMWTYWPEVVKTNSVGFNAIPTGYIDSTLESAPEKGFKEYAAFWLSDQSEDGQLGCYRYIHDQNPVIQKGKGDKKTLAMSVRCVKVEEGD